MNVMPRQFAMVALLAATVVGTASASAVFDPLFQLGKIAGTCLVRRPGIPDYEVGVEGRAYPFGSVLQTQDASDVTVFLSPSKQVRLGSATTLVVANAASDPEGTAKLLSLETGVLGLFLPVEDTELPLVVQTPVARFDNFKGRSELRLTRDADVNRLLVATAIGEARIQGPQFSVERLRRSAALEIVTALDESYTGLTGKSGEFELAVERGADDPVLASFRTGARVKIWRRKATVGGKLAVSVMIADGDGGVQASFAYLQGESSIAEAIKAAEPAVPGATEPAAAAPTTPTTPDGLFTEAATPAATPAAPDKTIKDSIWNF